jgi:hypothetical protein
MPVAAYGPRGSWWDLARVDSVWMLLVAAAMTALWHGRVSWRGVVAAALLLVAAFFAKQTAAPFMLVATLALARLAPRRLPLFVATLALAGLPPLWWMQRTSDGWFWFYVSKVHRAHAFSPRLVLGALRVMVALMAPAWALIGWALWRDRASTGLRYAAFVAGGAVAAAALAHGTAGAFVNSYAPAVYFTALATGLAASRLLAIAPALATRTYATMTVALLLVPGLMPLLASRVSPRLAGQYSSGFDLRHYVPSPESRRQGDALIARLRATPGDVWVAAHPYYAHLAGKRTFTSVMGAVDLLPMGMVVPGLSSAPFTALVLDEPPDPDTPDVIALCLRYRHSERLNGPDTVAGDKSVAQWRTP